MKIEERVLPDGEQRYTIAIPTDYIDEKPVPLVLALHFGGTVTPFYGRIILEGLIEPALQGLGAIIIAPDCPTNSWTDDHSEIGVLALLDHINEHYSIDPDKVLITGYSMGGNGAWHLAARNQDRFSAAVIMAGWPPPGIEEIDWGMPLYIIHSRQDELVPLEPTEVAVDALKAKGVSLEFVVLDSITHFETYLFVDPLREAISWIEDVWRG